MMRRLSYLFAVTLLLIACNKEEKEWDGPFIEIALETELPEQTKSDGVYPEDGVDPYLHENLISTVDFFFYPDGNTSADATYHVHKVSGKTRSDVFRLPLTSEQINTLIFPSQQDVTSCEVFVVVNYPGDEPLVPVDGDGNDILTNTSLADFAQREIVTNFLQPDPENPSSYYHPDFMMSGQTTLTLRGRNQVLSASGTVNLERYACKMTVGVNVSPQVLVGNDVWEPMLESMEIYLVEAVSNVSLTGRAPDPAYFSFRNHSMKFTDLNGNPLFPKTGDYLNTYPAYMYPQKWEYGATTSPNKEPYLKLVLPWRRVKGGITQKQFYYKIVIPNDHRPDFVRQFVRNNWYHINVDVGMLGAETDEDKVPIVDGSVYIAYWQDKNVVIKNAEIGKARYLAVDQARDTLYNIEEARLSYVTSHPVLIKELHAGRRYYGTQSVGSSALGGTIAKAGSSDALFPEGTIYLRYDLEYDEEEEKVYYVDGGERKAVWMENTGVAIEFTHPLNNNYKDTYFDYSPYVFTYTLVHADRPDDTQYLQHQTVLQYPAIFIECTPNPAKMVNNRPEHWGYVYVDNDQYTRARYDADYAKAENHNATWQAEHIWRVVHYSSGGRDMFKINVTVLPEESEFMLGDPRTRVVDNLRPDFAEAPAIEGGTRSLQSYYPTEASDRTVNMISPAYRISTKLSGTEYGGTQLEQARYRCASFQENGFPAGRWRLPTKGEIRFAAQLSANGVFEWQFNGNYWSANGAVNVNKDSGEVKDSNVTTAMIRCVYDSWYWGDEQVPIEQFTWADASR